MVHGLNMHPSYIPTAPCEAFACKWRGYAVMACKAEGCGTRWQREAAEDRARREQVDAKAKEDGKCL